MYASCGHIFVCVVTCMLNHASVNYQIFEEALLSGMTIVSKEVQIAVYMPLFKAYLRYDV